MSFARTVYRSQVASGPVEVNGTRVPDTYRVWSTPHPVHHGLVSRTGDWWVFTLTSVPTGTNTRVRYHLLEQALTAAGEIIGLKAGQDIHTRFTGVQRVAMGQQQCPKAMGSVLCGEPPMPGTIWCMWHPYGKPTGHV